VHVLYVIFFVLFLVCGFGVSENGNFLDENRVSNKGGL